MRLGRLTCRWSGFVVAVGLVATFLTTPATAEPVPIPIAKPRAGDGADAAFSSWINQFRKDALAEGISDATFELAFAGISVNRMVLKASERQPEFSRQIWTYLDGAVSDYRIRIGRERLAANRGLLEDISGRYGVPPHVIVAIWGLESSFGAAMGEIDIIEALATIAYAGRRKDYGHKELLATLTILENGYAKRSQLRGSWAGAMGHTQFIPSTYLAYAVDRDGDSRRDLWMSLPDVFASTANYLAKWKWQKDQSWGREVMLPQGFDHSLADSTIVKTVEDWIKLGLTSATSAPLDKDKALRASLLLPGGYTGPAFLIYQNFGSILRYNNSTAYALAVSHLSDRLNGANPLRGNWPKSEPALSRFDRIDMQKRLIQLGYEPGRVDGIIGAQTRAALRLFQKDVGVPADGFPTVAVLSRLKQGKGANP